MNAKIEKGKVTIDAELDKNPELSKTGKSLIYFTTRGFTEVKDEKGESYGISINLVKKRKEQA